MVAVEFLPDVVIGVATGGQLVADAMNFPGDCQQLTVRRQRQVTRVKAAVGLRRMLPILPTQVNDFLRRIEMVARKTLFRLRNHKAESSEVVVIGGSVDAILARPVRVLVVDDAVDSGGTLRDVIGFVRSHNAAAEIRSAVIVVTFERPLVQPDFMLWRQTIVRFPWSSDVRSGS
ncbi:MAG: hypothetical protein J0M28_07200 [Thauera sp.]|nr:hypothetical protein [Thauera sp.]